MIDEFVDFVHELFPSITPYAKDKVKESIRQFDESGEPCNYVMSQNLPYLAQGDVIETLTFLKYDNDGTESILRTKGMLLSNTCSAERDDQLLFAPLLPLASLDVKQEEIKKNFSYRLLYIPDSELIDYAVDLSLIRSFPRGFIENALSSKRYKKVNSLNKFGYYLFLAKLTIHLMRPEDRGVQETRVAI